MMAADTTGTPCAVLWDLDGTLVDSAPHHWIAWRETMLAEGVSISYAQFLATFGKKNDLILLEWLGEDVAPERSQRIGEEKEAHYRRLVAARGLTPLPGAASWVARLHAEGWRQAIASSAPRLNVEAVLGVVNFGRAFGAIVSAEDVRAGKPDPAVFLTAAARLDVPPARSIVVEDAAAGIEAARRAGMRSIGVNPAGDLPADIAVRSLADLPADAFARLLNRS
jgi:beta-phosphoglucomutase